MDISVINETTVEAVVPNPKYYLTEDLSVRSELPQTVKVELPNFDTYGVTTMVHVILLNGEINKNVIFYLLPMVNPRKYAEIWNPAPSDFVSKNGKNKKQPLPYFPEEVGNIISGAYEFSGRGKFFRGLRCTGGAFKNAISIDVVTERKNINLKLSSDKIQMCGATSDSLVIEAVDYIIGHIRTACEIVEYVRSKPQESLETIKVLREQTRGESKFLWKPDPENEDDLIITNHREIKLPTGPWTYIDSKLYGVLAPKINEAVFHGYDYGYVEYMFDLLEDVVKNPDILVVNLSDADTPLNYRAITRSMVNYNYSLGFHVFNYRLQNTLSRLFTSCDFYKGCLSTYQNTGTRRVKVTMPFVISEEYASKIWRNPKTPMEHTFTITKKGPVTQSGPHENMMVDVYYKIIGAIMSVRSMVEDLVSEGVKRDKILLLIEESRFSDMLRFKKAHPRDFSGWLKDRSRDRSIDYSDIRDSLKHWLDNNRKAKLIKELDDDLGVLHQ